ncbi:hypothetical protein N7532_010630 [Penicillium argentinense]|uniref:Uncharacterized protein n=1 Tax=Penicillium argentinense TaxID=1131581 RepID=A0A9W9JXU2_9EURO|nr:uncharacterized protein N7532_010630 [Penicillium argentinense]KAJ5085859.1 hypothetical protein N7532_010630 [Penicillium argentinense]
MGALSTLWPGDKFGSKKVVFGGSVVSCVGAAIQLWWVGKIFTSKELAFVTATVPMWQSEFAKPIDECVFAGILGAFIINLPESPRRPVKNGRIEVSKAIFAALDGIPIYDPHVFNACRGSPFGARAETGQSALSKNDWHPGV